MDRSTFFPLRSFTPFRALHAVVEFFAPWQKDERKDAQIQVPDRHVDASTVARHLQRTPHLRTPQVVCRDDVSPARARLLRSKIHNTARPAANQPLQGVTRPLRVIRTVDNQIPASASGRMVISGRLADVCAELERLSDAAQA